MTKYYVTYKTYNVLIIHNKTLALLFFSVYRDSNEGLWELGVCVRVRARTYICVCIFCRLKIHYLSQSHCIFLFLD